MLTLCWGLNWPVMKLGISGFPPLSFRTLSMWIGLPVLFGSARWSGTSLRIARADWPELAKLTMTNMVIWYVVAILSLRELSSGRAAILGYTMPIFSALLGAAFYGERLAARAWGGVAAAALGVTLLMWHELGSVAGKPWAALGMLGAAMVWALGTRQLRNTRIQAPTLAIIVWMTVLTTLVMTALSVLYERDGWTMPGGSAWFGILYNAFLIVGYAQPIWLTLARSLPPIASSLSVMMIPVLGTVSGALWLGEQLHWQDYAAIVLMLAAIASVLLPSRSAAAQD